ncbi:hypothetical protein BEN47_14460 [Hymenobacter lapidarius]|uniref:BLUF domain-containing protein n=1 Tax=Hymenobacter lapidarius TaxID=1908237 RepID=A0A1G1T4J2_9BACT|nr:BLUF domain-containing protein [Hymenobacter lapidarius]OGX85791.1 hypothetical protein BEN47_14460 [Hymenobacter lapidarius]
MHHLVYTSTATAPLTEDNLRGQLGHWRATNARLGVTGVLLYSEGNVLQVLEGDSEVIRSLFATIARDVRHRSITKIADGPVPGRAFSDWSMRFRAVESADYDRFVQQIHFAPNHASSLAPLLEAFMASDPLD